MTLGVSPETQPFTNSNPDAFLILPVRTEAPFILLTRSLTACKHAQVN